MRPQSPFTAFTTTDSSLPPGGDEAGDTLTVMTVNTHKGFTSFNRRFILPELRDAVRRVGADLVFLQEVHGTREKHSRKDYAGWTDELHYEYLADSIWPDTAYGRNVAHTRGDHGNAIMSKFPIVEWENHDVSIAGPERRGLLRCVIRHDAAGSRPDLHAICVHLGLAEVHRAEQIRLLCDIVATEVPPGAPLVVAGDFNDWRQRAHDALFRRTGLREVFLTAYGDAARTFPSIFPLLPLDRIYVRDTVAHLPVVLPRKPWSRLSDHAPLAAQIRW